MNFVACSHRCLGLWKGIQTLRLGAAASRCPAQDIMASTKGLRVRNSPICTLSQNGYGAGSALAATTGLGVRGKVQKPLSLRSPSTRLHSSMPTWAVAVGSDMQYTWPGSNWRPSACEADVIATRPQVLLAGSKSWLAPSQQGSALTLSLGRLQGLRGTAATFHHASTPVSLGDCSW